MSGTPATFAPRLTITPNALSAFGGVWRLTVRRFLAPSQWLGLCALLGVVALLALVSARHDSPEDYAEWAAGFYLTFLLPMLAFISAAGAIRDELKPASTDYIFTRPLPRALFVVFKYVSHVAVAQVSYLLALGVVMGVAWFRGMNELWAHLPLLVFAQVLTVCAASGFGFLCGMLTSRYVVVGIVYASVVEVGIGQIPTQLSLLSMIRQVKTLLGPLLDGGPSLGAAAFITPLLVLVAFTALTVAVAAALLHFREFSGARGKDT